VKQLRPYQKEAVEILAEGGLNASGLGAGKTLMAVEGVRMLRLGRSPRVLVVAPISVDRQWQATFVEQFPTLEEKNLVHIVGTPQADPEGWRRLTRKEPGVFIIGWQAMHGGIPERIRREASSGKNRTAKKPPVTVAAVRKAIAEGTVPPWTRTGTWDLLVMDEVHRACNKDGLPHYVLKAIKADRKLGMSHTPGGNSPEGLYAVLNLLWPEKYTNFWSWVADHFKVIEETIYKRGPSGNATPHGVLKIGPELRPGSIWDDIPAVVRYRTEEVYDQLPPVIDRTAQVAMSPEQEEQYLDFAEQSLAWLGDMPISTPLPIEQRTRLRQAALGTLKAEETSKRKVAWLTEDGLDKRKRNPGVLELQVLEEKVSEETGVKKYKVSYVQVDLDISYDETAPQLKLEAVKDILADLPESEPLLVWTHSAKWARMAEKALGSQAVSWTSSTTQKKRRQIEDEFGTRWRVLIAQLQSLSEGVDWLKDACRCEVIASVTEDEVMNQQAEGRLHRPGQTSPVQRWRLVTEGTVDEDVSVNNLKKRLRMGSLYKDNQKTERVA
jgi:SNF2 family DNA or RNA helicase